MELKNTTWELHEAYTGFNSQTDPAEERISETEDQLNEKKQEGKIREKRVKRNEQSLQEIWGYVKRPNLCLTSIPECEREWIQVENTIQGIIQRTSSNEQGRPIFKSRKYREYHEDISQEEQPQGI